MFYLYSCPELVLDLWDLSVDMKLVVFSIVIFTDSPCLSVPCMTVALLENRHIFTGRECRRFFILDFFFKYQRMLKFASCGGSRIVCSLLHCVVKYPFEWDRIMGFKLSFFQVEYFCEF